MSRPSKKDQTKVVVEEKPEAVKKPRAPRKKASESEVAKDTPSRGRKKVVAVIVDPPPPPPVEVEEDSLEEEIEVDDEVHVDEIVNDVIAAELLPTSSEAPTTVGHTKTRSVVSRDTVAAEFVDLVTFVDEHIAKLRDTPSSDKTNGVKFLRSVCKRIKTLQTNTTRVLKQKQPSSRKNNNAGFLKPVKISAEMAKFTGLDPNGLHSRVDVTKFLCSYIKQHNLQNPEDKRQIKADHALAKLLAYDAKTSEKPLTYYHLQFLLKNHFTKST